MVSAANEAQRKQKLTAAMKKRAATFTSEYNELHKNKQVKTKYSAEFTGWEDAGRTEGSCWGPDIADVASFMAGETIWSLDAEDGSPVVISDVGLFQALQRAFSAIEKGSPLCVAVTDPSIPGKDAFIVRTSSGSLLMFGFDDSGTVHDVTIDSLWVTDNGDSIDDKTLCFEVTKAFDAGTPSQVKLGDKTINIAPRSGSVTVFGFKDAPMVVKAKRAVTLTPGLDRSAPLRIDSKAIADSCRMLSLRGHLTDVIELPHGKCVITDITDLRPAADGKIRFKLFNYNGIGQHATVARDAPLDIPLFRVRSENFNEKVGLVPASRTKLVATDADGKNPRMTSVADALKNAGELAKHAGMDAGTDLSHPSDNEKKMTVRIQAFAVPCDQQGQEIKDRIFAYGSEMVYLYATPDGTTWQSSAPGAQFLQPTRFDEATGTLSKFNLRIKPSNKSVEDMGAYTAADNAANLAGGDGMAVPLGPVGMPTLANISMLVQVPATAPPPPEAAVSFRSLSSTPGDGSSAEYRSMSSSEGTVTAAKLSLGSYQGVGAGVKAGVQRRTNSQPTATINLYFAVSPPDGSEGRLLPGEYGVSKKDILAIGKQLDKINEIIDSVDLFQSGICHPDAGDTSEKAVLDALLTKVAEGVAVPPPQGVAVLPTSLPIFSPPTPMEVVM